MLQEEGSPPAQFQAACLMAQQACCAGGLCAAGAKSAPAVAGLADGQVRACFQGESRFMAKGPQGQLIIRNLDGIGIVSVGASA